MAITATAQKKEPTIEKGTISKVGKPEIKDASADTMVIAEKVKIIKIGNQVIPVEVLKEAVLILNEKQINGFYLGIQEYPAKFANPFSEYFIKYFGLQQKQKQ
jgi:hypothetical protein